MADTLTLMSVLYQSSDGRKSAREATFHQPLSFTLKDMQINFLLYFLFLFSLDFISM